MRKSSALIVSALLLPVVCTAAEGTVQQVLSEASKALGVEGLTSIQYSGAGQSFTVGQAGSVNSAWPKFNDTSYQRTVSFSPWGSQLIKTRTQGENPPRGGGGQPLAGEQKQTQVVAPGSANADALPDELAVSLPQAFIKAASAAKDVVVKSGSKDGKRYAVVEYTAGNKATTRGWINEKHLIERVETTVDQPVLGDTSYSAVFSDYRDFGDVTFPAHIVQEQGGYPLLDLHVSTVKINVPTEFPPAASSPLAATVASEQLGDGIFLITGGYAAVAVDSRITSPSSRVGRTISDRRQSLPRRSA